MGLKVITPPTAEPVTVQDALAHCNIDHTDDNLLLARYITAARERLEKTTLRRALMPQTLRLTLDRFSSGILLPRPPAIEIDSITYIDTAGDEQTWEDYHLDADREPARLEPAYGSTWPEVRCQSGAVKITYQAGYANAAAVPQTTKLAILMLVAHWYEHRESVTDEGRLSETPQSVDFLLAGERVFRFG